MLVMLLFIGRFGYSAEVVLCCLKAFGEGSDFSQSDGPKTGQPCISSHTYDGA